MYGVITKVTYRTNARVLDENSSDIFGHIYNRFLSTVTSKAAVDQRESHTRAILVSFKSLFAFYQHH